MRSCWQYQICENAASVTNTQKNYLTNFEQKNTVANPQKKSLKVILSCISKKFYPVTIKRGTVQQVELLKTTPYVQLKSTQDLKIVHKSGLCDL